MNAAARQRPSFRARHTRATVAVEFAVLVVPLFTLLLGVIELGYDLFIQTVLNYAVNTAARSVQVGITQGSSGENSATFVTSAVCPAAGGLLDCRKLVVGVAPVPTGYTYYNNPSPLTLTTAASTGGSICTGQATQLMQLQAWYIGPTFVGGLIPTFATSYNGAQVHISSAATGFVNEAFPGGQSKGVGC